MARLLPSTSWMRLRVDQLGSDRRCGSWRRNGRNPAGCPGQDDRVLADSSGDSPTGFLPRRDWEPDIPEVPRPAQRAASMNRYGSRSSGATLGSFGAKRCSTVPRQSLVR